VKASRLDEGGENIDFLAILIKSSAHGSSQYPAFLELLLHSSVKFIYVFIRSFFYNSIETERTTPRPVQQQSETSISIPTEPCFRSSIKVIKNSIVTEEPFQGREKG
jgi:hypothetical protein